MGLVGFTLNSKNVYDYIYYNGNTYNSSTKTWTKMSSTGSITTWTGSTTFTSSFVPLISSSVCYQVVKPEVTTPTYTASVVKAEHKYPWTMDCPAVSSSGQYESYTVDYDAEFIEVSWLFEYAGSAQQWVVPTTGTYSFECWGASGGGSRENGTFRANTASLGGYTYGEISLTKDAAFYVYVGQKGTDAVTKKNSAGGWNGGGLGTWDTSDDESAGAGGGATDIRLTSGNWNNFDGLKSRIMVAGGGGGRNYRYEEAGYGFGGGIEGGYGYGYGTVYTTPGGQNSGHAYFGKGEDATGVGDSDGQAGGGGGYYGGRGGGHQSNDSYSGGGGSSFVSGLTGCIAIDESSTSSSLVLKDNSEHYSGYVFSNASTISGNTSEAANQPITGVHSSTKQKGQNGNGYVRITRIISE